MPYYKVIEESGTKELKDYSHPPKNKAISAIDVSYDSSNSPLSATNVQGAIDELVIGNLIKDITYPVGTIIESTTCDTMAKVVATYGGTTWIQHSGYVLRGATSGVVANSATKTGGSDTHTLTVNEMPSHTHTQNAHNHGIGVAGNTGTVGNNIWAATTASGYTNSWGDPTDGSHVYGRVSQNGNRAGVVSSTTAVNNNTGGGQAFSVLENYKSVYIWERTE